MGNQSNYFNYSWDAGDWTRSKICPMKNLWIKAHTSAWQRTGERKCVELLRFHTWMEPSGNVASIKKTKSHYRRTTWKYSNFSFFIAYSPISSETSLYFLSKSWYNVCCLVVYLVFSSSHFKQGGVHWIKKKKKNNNRVSSSPAMPSEKCVSHMRDFSVTLESGRYDVYAYIKVQLK